MSQDKLWLLKHKTGRVQGPLSSDEIIQRIKDKIIHGEETIAIYPGGRWKPISVEPLFYEQLLQILSYTEEEELDTIHSSSSSQKSHFDSSENISSATVIADLSELRSIRKNRKRKKRSSSKRLKRKSEAFLEKTVIYKPEGEEYELLKEEEGVDRAVEENKRRLSFFQRRKGWILAFSGVVVVFALLFFQDEAEKKHLQEYIELKNPKRKHTRLTT